LKINAKEIILLIIKNGWNCTASKSATDIPTAGQQEIMFILKSNIQISFARLRRAK
tara:strand:- start:211292 stop:211459 length:168 start_codon:yes stop_codon:yes gene_type:complete